MTMERSKDKQKKMEAAYDRVFGSPEGRKVLRDLMSEFQMFSSSHVVGSDPSQTAFHEGERNVVLHILRMIQRTNMNAHDLIDERQKWNDEIAEDPVSAILNHRQE